jgi:integrase
MRDTLTPTEIADALDTLADVMVSDRTDELAGYACGQSLDLWDPGLAEVRLFTLSRPTAWRRIKAAARAAGLAKRITPHSLRHSHAHHLRLKEWPLELIAERLGHANLDTTKIYTRPAEMELQIALPAMPWNDET